MAFGQAEENRMLFVEVRAKYLELIGAEAVWKWSFLSQLKFREDLNRLKKQIWGDAF